MGEAVEMALDLLDKRKNEYKNNGVDYYQPWLVLMSDGGPTDSITNAVSKTINLENNKKLTVFPIAIGSGSHSATLSSFSPKRGALQLQGLNFKDFFEWLSQSVSRTSQSMPGEKVQLAPVAGWAEI